MNGDRMLAPHRLHLNQRLANGGWGHGKVTTLYFGVAAAGAALALVLRDVSPLALLFGYVAAVTTGGYCWNVLRPFTVSRSADR